MISTIQYIDNVVPGNHPFFGSPGIFKALIKYCTRRFCCYSLVFCFTYFGFCDMSIGLYM